MVDLSQYIGKRFGELTVLTCVGKAKDGSFIFNCECDCGHCREVVSHKLNGGYITDCGCGIEKRKLAKQQQYIKDHIGLTSGKLTILDAHHYNKSHKMFYWLCQCSCGSDKEVIVGEANFTSGRTKSCGCLMKEVSRENFLKISKKAGSLNKKWKGHGEISGSFFRVIKSGALNRNLQFDITIEQIWDLFLKQERKCVYTGQILTFPKHVKDKTSGTASLDRIDSTKGYTIDNVQWVHKIINIIKWDFNEQDFLSMCNLVVRHCKNIDYERPIVYKNYIFEPQTT